MCDATKNAERVVMYTAFERTQIRALQKAVPSIDAELEALVANVQIARWLVVAGTIAVDEQARVRQDLFAYCERDTWATVVLVDKLHRLALTA